ncbi:glycerol-3-phosphate dehydrogenase, partial [Escherichia coli]|nr:glycerol-3-phosphate dehydrogenase [Escherichia coli]
LGSARSVIDLGRHFGGDFYECEADFLRATEWAEKPADFLERRTKHGLHLTRAQRDAFEAHL